MEAHDGFEFGEDVGLEAVLFVWPEQSIELASYCRHGICVMASIDVFGVLVEVKIEC